MAAVSIGIGGMVGAGIFSILGVVAQAAGNAMWIAFAIGGVVALLSTYSYARLGATFPSAGGAVHFLVKSFGDRGFTDTSYDRLGGIASGFLRTSVSHRGPYPHATPADVERVRQYYSRHLPEMLGNETHK